MFKYSIVCIKSHISTERFDEHRCRWSKLFSNKVDLARSKGRRQLEKEKSRLVATNEGTMRMVLIEEPRQTQPNVQQLPVCLREARTKSKFNEDLGQVMLEILESRGSRATSSRKKTFT